ncbi:MAG: hypothetical protein AAB652_01330 [Patescibacteria group bacterium]
MENEPQNNITEDFPSVLPKKEGVLSASILISVLILAGAWIYTTGLKAANNPQKGNGAPLLEEKALPSDGVVLPVAWGDLGARLVAAGAIDESKFKAMYDRRGAFPNEYENLLLEKNNGNIKITGENAGYLLNLFWALGLSNKNKILDEGPMMDPRYGNAGGFASTGGWTLAKGDPMDHYSMHVLIPLTEDEQTLVERVSKNVYRPCCDNATYFPDCNHGMAMLGLLELLASQGVTEAQMYRVALQVNSYWFPEQYATIARYFESEGISPQSVDPKEAVSAAYSSGSGFRRIASLVPPETEKRPSGGCGV